MTVAQGRGITAYQQFQDTRKEGAPSRLGGFKVVDALSNPLLALIGTITFGGTEADGNYDTTIVDDITGESILVRTVRATTPASNTDLATQHALDINELSALNGVASATSLGAVVTITFEHPDITFTITNSSPGGATLVFAQTQAAGGSVQLLARFVRASGHDGDNKIIADLETTSIASDVIGFVVRPQAGEVENAGSRLDADVDSYRAGSMVNGLVKGFVQALSVDAATFDGNLFVVRDTTGGDELGQLRASAAGTAHVVEAAPTAGNDELNQLNVTMINESTGAVIASQTFNVLSDGTATDAEIVDAFVIQIDLSDLVVTHGLASANVSDDLELTAPLGVRLVVQSTGVGTLTVADVTAFAMFTIELPKANGRFEEPIAAGAVGEIYVSFLAA